jgi:ankyrin repeat protein
LILFKHGQVDIIKWFIETKVLQAKLKTSISASQRSVLHLAAKHGENEILRLICEEFIKCQMSTDMQDLSGNTAAHLAAKYNNLDCLQV